MATLAELIPDADALLALEPEELSGPLMEHFLSFNRSGGGIHPDNSFDDMGPIVNPYPASKRQAVQEALRESWAWLVREGLLVEKASSGWHRISRRGERMHGHADVDAYRLGMLLPRQQLHPAIANDVWATFLRGSYDTAVFEALRDVEVALRKACGYSNSEYGVSMMRKAFGDNGPLLDGSRERSEQQAMSDLFAGAMGLYKNPTSHRNQTVGEPREAVEIIVLASHLLHVVDARVAARTPQAGLAR